VRFLTEPNSFQTKQNPYFFSKKPNRNKKYIPHIPTENNTTSQHYHCIGSNKVKNKYQGEGTLSDDD